MGRKRGREHARSRVVGARSGMDDGALRRNPCVISCVCQKPLAPRPRHLVPLLGELGVSLLLFAVFGTEELAGP